MHRTALWLFLAALSLALTATAQEGKPQKPTPGGQRFAHPRGLYSFVVPTGWTAEAVSDELTVAVSQPGKGTARLEVREIGPGADSVVGFESFAQFSKALSGREAKSVTVMAGGRKALRVTYRPMKDAGPGVGRMIELYIRNNRDDVLVFSFEATHFARERAAFERLLATVQFSPLPQKPPADSYLLSGRITNRAGNCQPMVRPGQCVEQPVQGKVYVHELTGPEALDSVGYLERPPPLVAQVETDRNGRYEVFLPSGRYSLFVEDSGRVYCPDYQSVSACLVEVPKRAIRHDVRMRHHATF
jgi:hypothetical protein